MLTEFLWFSLTLFPLAQSEVAKHLPKVNNELVVPYTKYNNSDLVLKRSIIIPYWDPCSRGRKCIFGGKPSGSGTSEYGHLAALGYGDDENPSFNCGGSLINKKFVLTAAHCLYSSTYGKVKMVRLGTLDIDKPTTGYADYKVAEIIQHPDYTFRTKYNDIALLRLANDVKFTSSIKPASLFVESRIPTSLMVMGWGSKYAGGPLTSLLQEAVVKPYNQDVCEKFYHGDKRVLPNGINHESMICAGGGLNNKRKDTCSGDSGGPLQTFGYTKTYIVGVTSFGKKCGLTDAPGIYTSVSYYINWLQNIMEKY